MPDALAFFEEAREVATLGKLHDDVQVAALEEVLVQRDYVDVLQGAHHINLLHRVKLLLLGQAHDVDLLGNQALSVLLACDQQRATKSALADASPALIVLH